MCLACVKRFAFQRESWLVVRGSLTLLSGAESTLSLSSSKNGVSHRSEAPEWAAGSQLMSVSFLYSSKYPLELAVPLQ